MATCRPACSSAERADSRYTGEVLIEKDSGSELTHLDSQGQVRMVDVAEKSATVRRARASGLVRLSPDTILLLREGKTPKGDVLAAARIAGILGAKRTADLIPLCHPLALTSVNVEAAITVEGVRITAEAGIVGQTGVEMEALTAVSIACLTIYDMVKAVERGAVITDIRLEEKSGGRSGEFIRSKTDG